MNKRIAQKLIDYIFSLTDFNICIKFKDLISPFIIKEQYDNKKYIMEWVVKKCNILTIKWLHENNIIEYTSDTVIYASIYDRLDIVKWLHENIFKNSIVFKPRAIEWAASFGYLDLVKWLYENIFKDNIECIDKLMNLAVSANHIHIVKFLREKQKD